jgi:tripartite-type tricarboxylate transporter receptor subunit TctC
METIGRTTPRRMTAGALAAATLSAMAAIMAGAPAAPAQDGGFFAGRTVTLNVGLPAGGIYGLYGRLLTEHLPRHIPGRPSMVVQFMQGAGGLTGANYLGSAAPKDGSYIALLFKDAVITQLLRPGAAKYDAGKFGWLGRVTAYNAVLVVSGASGIRRFEETRTRQVIMGATGGKATGSYMIPTMLNSLAGTKFKVIAGYAGAAGMTMAMEKGETQGWAGGALTGYKGPRAQDVRAGKVVILLQSGLERDREHPDVPLLREVAGAPENRPAVEFIDSSNVVGLSLAAPAGVPADRVEALRAALARTLADPAFVQDVTKRNLDVQPMAGAALQKFVADTLATPKEVVKRVQAILKL